MTADSARRDAGAAANLTNRSDKKADGERSKKWERRSDARPKELISAALELFARRGFAGTRLEDVAAKAGVSKATVYLYFKNKEDLFEAVVREAVMPTIEQAEEMLEVYPGPTVDLLRTFVALFEHKLDGPLPALIKLIVAESGNFPKLAQLWVNLGPRRALTLLRRILQRGIERKELRPFDPENVAPLIAAPLIMLALWKQALAPHTDFRLDPRALLSEHVEIFIRGLAAHAPTAAGEAAALGGADPRMKSPKSAPHKTARRKR
jgi:AcrR family transcriptional regulator